MATKKKKPAETLKDGFNTNNAKWVKAVRYYINGDCDGKQEKCMLKAGFAKTTARTYNYKIKKHPDYLAWQKTQTKKNIVTKEQLNEKLVRWANSNVVDYFDFGNFIAGKDNHDNPEYRLVSVKDLTKLSREVTDCISEIQETSNGIRIKLVDKLAAVAKLAEINGLIAAKKLEVGGDPDKPLRFTFGTENLKPPASAPKNRMTGFMDGK